MKLKKKETKLKYKPFFLIANLIIAIIAFSYILGTVNAGLVTTSDYNPTACSGDTCPISQVTPPPASPPSNAPIGSTGGTGLGRAIGDVYKGALGVFSTTPNGENNVPGVTDASDGYAIPSSPSAAGAPTPNGRVVEVTPSAGGQVPFYPTNPNVGNANPNVGDSGAPTIGNAAGPGTGGKIGNYFSNLPQYLGQIAMGAGIGATIGALAGGKNGWMWGTIAGAAGTLAYQMATLMLPNSPMMAGLIGIGVFLLIFLLTYKKESKEIVEFNCLPWQAPIGGEDCEKCNLYEECSEYTCKSLGQACDLVNIGTKEQKCIWKNPYDTNSPTIEMTNVTRGHNFVPDKTIRPPATGVEILNPSGKDNCIKAFNPLEFTFMTNEPSQCKIDYSLTTDSKLAFEQMSFYVGGVTTFSYNHTEKLALPGPDAINKLAPELKNDGTYTLYIRCMDANGNFNVNPFSVRFCVETGPDTTPPMIVNVSIPSGSPVQFNISKLDLEVYVNEPADCKWSRENRDYEQMEGNMTCNNQLWEMNNENTYTCRVTLTGIESRKDNLYFFRCKDKPDFEEKDRNANEVSYSYIIKGTQPLNILESGPNSTIYGATETIPVVLFIRTDNGYNNGEAKCYYSYTGNENSYIEFSNTSTLSASVNYHTQRQDLITGNYIYYFKCVDLGGNAVYNITKFRVETDLSPPFIARVYKESGELKIITQENAECSFSNANCNFEIDSGIKMATLDYVSHNTEWKSNKYYYIRCKDKYNNEPNPNTCSIILRPFEYGIKESSEGTIEL